LDVGVLDMAFYPVPMEVLGNLLFFGLSSVILFFLLCIAIYLFFCSLFYGQSAISSSASDVMSSGYKSAI
jgi:ABC-type Co2+ transport system permease subunit